MSLARNNRLGREAWKRHLKDQQVFNGNLNTILKDAAKDTGRVVQNNLGDEQLGVLVRRAQYADARTGILQVQSDMFDKVDARTRKGITQAAGRAEDMWRDVDGALSRGIKSDELRSTFLRSTDRVLSDITSRYVNAIDLSQSVYRNKALASGAVDRVVNNGILGGKSAAEIASDVRHLIRPDTPGGVSYAAKRLGRTELNNAFHTTTVRGAQAQPWVEGMQWFLSGSHPRKDVCNEYAEQDNHNMGAGVFPSRLVPGKPHPQCLCYVTAVTPSDDEFLENLFKGDYDSFMDEDSSS